MSRLPLPQRVAWKKSFLDFSTWSAVVGLLITIIPVIAVGFLDLNAWIKIGIIVAIFIVVSVGYMILMKVGVMWKRLKQYDPLYDTLESIIIENQQLQGSHQQLQKNHQQLQEAYQQLQENLKDFIQNINALGLQAFTVTSIQWGNPSPLLVIACNQNLPQGSKFVIIKVATLEAMGQFVIEQHTHGGYLIREDRIFNAVWWGYLHNQVARYPHPRIDDTLAILLH